MSDASGFQRSIVSLSNSDTEALEEPEDVDELKLLDDGIELLDDEVELLDDGLKLLDEEDMEMLV